jgi:hypothetical protein
MASMQDRKSPVDSVSSTMALARARDTIALANWLEQAILGRGEEGTWHNLHRRELWTSAGRSGPGGIGSRLTA